MTTAQQLLTTRIKAGAPDPLAREGIRSWAYYHGQPYPDHTPSGSPIEKWNTADDGPYPTCQPLPKYIIDTSADFLFQEPPSFVASTPELTALLGEILSANEVAGKLRDEAVRAGNEGSVVVKFAFTPDNKRRPVAIHWLSISDVEFFYDPLDADLLEMARVQFKYRRNDGTWWWYREEWTTTDFTLYAEIPADKLADREIDNSRWQVAEQKPNEFGIIPLRCIYNIKEAGVIDGRGDLWDLWPVIDRYNYQCWLWDRSSQLDGDPVWAIINAVGEVGDPAPGQVLRLNGEGADMKAVEALGMMAPHRTALVQLLHNWVIDAASVVRLETEKLTNKGNFTRAVLEQLHAPLIRLTNRKRRQWGENGLEEFFEDMLVALSRVRAGGLGKSFAALGAITDDPATYDVQCCWPGFFALSEDERAAGLANLATAEVNGFLTRQMVIERALGYFDGIDETEAVPEVLAQYAENPVVTAAREAAAQKAQSKAVKAGEPDVVPQ